MSNNVEHVKSFEYLHWSGAKERLISVKTSTQVLPIPFPQIDFTSYFLDGTSPRSPFLCGVDLGDGKYYIRTTESLKNK